MIAPGPSEIDKALLRLAREKFNCEAWDKVYTALAPRAFAQAYRLLGGDRFAAEDACHDSFVRLMSSNAIGQLKTVDDLERYLSTIVRNRCIDKHRGDSREAISGSEYMIIDFDDSSPFKNSQQEDASVTPEEIYSLKSKKELLRGNLSRVESLLLELLIVGYSADEIAARLGITVENTNVRVHRLRKKLRERDDV